MEKINDLKQIHFNLTCEMHDDLIEILVIEQMIKEKKYKDGFELKLLTEYKNELTKKYVANFRENNKEQIKQYKEFMYQYK